MKKFISCCIILLAATPIAAQNNVTAENNSTTVETMKIEPISEMLFPILFISFLIYMLTSLVKYFLDYRLKNKLIDRGMSEQLSAYILDKNGQEKKNGIIRLAILFCGLGIGLTITYLTAPIHIHSLAIMAFSLALSYFAYFFYLRK